METNTSRGFYAVISRGGEGLQMDHVVEIRVSAGPRGRVIFSTGNPRSQGGEMVAVLHVVMMVCVAGGKLRLRFCAVRVVG